MATIQKVSGIDFANISKFDGVDISSVGSINLIGKPVTGSLLLDQSYGSGAEAAYSVRKLRTAYTGAAIQVQATIGGATAEIGFDVNNNLDTATLLAFAGTNEVRVSIWYDQSTNGNNATQVTVSRRPIVVAAGGALVKEGDRLALLLDGTDDGFNLSAIGAASSKFGFITHSVDSSDTAWSLLSDTATTAVIPLGQSGSGSAGVFRYTMNNIYSGGALISPNTRGDIYNAYTSAGQSLTALDFSADAVDTLFNRTSFVMQGKAQEVVLYASDKSSDRTSIEENIGDYYTPNPAPYLLDTYTGSAAAYSLRLLDSTYTGFAIKVQDNVGGATQDIGFNVFGELDTVSLSAYGGSNDVFVETWYDQSGNSNNAVQATTANRPKIYDGATGAVIVENGKPSVYFKVNDRYENITASISTLHSAFAVAKSPDQNRKQIYGFGGAGAYQNFEFGFWNTTLSQTFIGNGSSYNEYGSSQTPNTDVNLFSNIYNGATYKAYADTAASVNVSETKTSSAALSIGARNSFTMYVSELILYSSDQTANRTGIETNIGGYYDIPLAGLLDKYTGAAAGYSLRRLSSTYTGSAIKVQDTVGGATLDVGFDSNGELDTAAIVAYGGSNDVFVETWYDQSGNGNNSTQATSANRPKIYDGATSAVIVENGKPAVQFDGSNDTLQASVTSSNIISTNAENTLLAVMNQDSTSVSNGLVSMANPRYVTYTDFNGTLFYDAGNNSSNRLSVVAPAGWDDAQHLLFWSSSLTLQQICVDGTQLASNTSQSTVSSASTTLIIGAYTTANLKGLVQEIVLYPSDESANRTDIETNINTFYNIY